MKVTFKIRRFDPEKTKEPYWQEFPLAAEPGMVVLYGLHEIHDRQDGTLAYRYSCRGAICGSCAMRINGKAGLACKTQISEIANDGDTVQLEPLLNMPVVKDLVVDQTPFFDEIRKSYPWLTEARTRKADEPVAFRETMSQAEYDQWNRSSYCIRCQACFSDCPKRLEDPTFVGPQACVDRYKYIFNPLDALRRKRLKDAAAPGGVFDCDKHGNCVKVCPKDIRPMRAITFIQRKIKDQEKQD
jgi:succinate dehydrogenase / fumarate reductase iron-sulfur subunit